MRGKSAATKELIRLAQRVLEENHPQTLRQVHYAISSLGLPVYQNDAKHYRKLSRVLTEARRLYRKWELARKPTESDKAIARRRKIPLSDVVNARMYLSMGGDDRDDHYTEPPELAIPGDWIVDELRQGEHVSVWEDVSEYIQTVRASYRRDYWQDQSYHVEVWGEKATVLGALPVAELKRRIVKAVQKLINFERWDRQAATEAVEFESITRVADAMKNLPQAEA